MSQPDAAREPAAAPQPDGLRLALLNNRFEGISRAMMNTLLRTARSAILNTARDFSCCVLTAGDELLAMAESLPIHVMSGPDLMAAHMKQAHPNLKRGDAFLNNSPYHGNSHAADWSLLVPVIDDAGVHRYTVLAKAHLADCGNAIPTTYSAAARDVYEEGALIFPCVQVQHDYQDRADVLEMARTRIRVPELWHGDFLALLGAARIGERRLLELLDELGPQALADYERDWFDYSERRMADAIGRLPAGRAVTRGRHDPVPGAPDGVPVQVAVDVDPQAGRIAVDLTDNPDCLPCGLNLTRATSKTAAMIGIFTGLGAEVPPNAGSFRRIEVRLRENCVVGIPRHPHSCSAATTNLSELTANLVAGALAELGEGCGMAATGRNQPPATGVISGVDPREHGGPFVNQLMLAVTGGAGGPVADGWLTTLGIGAAGFLLRDSVEIDEMKYPIRVHEQRLIADSEGAGRRRGSPGAHVEYGPVGCELEVIWLSDGTENPAAGVRGGLDGAPAQQRLRSADGTLGGELGTYAQVTVAPGERLVSISCGGAGYGPPREREPARVVADVREGYVTRERARDTYRVALHPDGTLDADTTTRLRETR
ncbi:hydantoinase B/oxoprolinase family protein [Conexibacter stalactiti]|uniref:Hydantoinase B/oxoprolinase family protein n=1 Tax=Conexibacter stalactiti TaxID=1940611 RepID=A0ABU4HSQ8_9ACTN|nr:hydantoinase B/oxoprolinase family protein [Conexibacter stalactiti]MDW5596308.1 hydantoinase B/oxoprolinase family protein [Conexibacter stalactiti]MEC5036950.1 hydantoinase B/oxoprolinase family protein [Conexibacter stalactiti]